LYLNIWLHAGSTFTGGTLNSSAWASNTNANRAAGISSFFDSTDRTFFITGVQLEIGQNPTEFEIEPYETTLLKCQRYYYKSHDYSLALANANSTNFSFREERTQTHSMPVNMRSGPTFTATLSIKSLSSGDITISGGYDFAVSFSDAYEEALPSGNYWYGGYTADAEL